MLVVLSRALSALEFGIFSFAFSLGLFLARIGVAGQSQKVMREIGLVYQESSPDEGHEVARAGYIVASVASLIICGVLIVHGLYSGSSYQVALALFVPVMAISELQTFVLRAYGSISGALIPREVAWRIAVCVAMGSVVITGFEFDATDTLILIATILLATTAYQARFLTPSNFWRSLPQARKIIDSTWIRESSDFWIISVISIAVPAISTAVVGGLVSPVDAGPYFVALRTAQLLSLVFVAVNLVAAPLLSRLSGKESRAELQGVCTVVAAVSTAAATVGMCIVVIFGDSVLRLFGGGFEEAYLVLVLISLGYFATACFGSNAQLLQMHGEQQSFKKILIISNSVGVATLPLLTALYGPVGAAMSVCMTMIGWNVWTWRVAKSLCAVDTSILSVVRICVSRRRSHF